MYISKMRLKNFRCFDGEHSFSFGPGINYFVGNNNAGKTTIFRAIEFLKSGKTKEGWITEGRNDEDVYVEITIEGTQLKELLEVDNLKKYQPYLIDGSKLRLRRGSETTTWIDKRNREKEITIKNIAIYNPNSDIFENPTGVDNVISALFDAQFVYSDLDNSEFQNFSKTTTIAGKLISAITKDFQTSPEWSNFKEAHSRAFGSSGFTGVLNGLKTKIENILEEQYGSTTVDFNFGVPTIENFLKTGQILLEENGIQTDVAEKGTGMQRALALTLIQIYAEIGQKNLDVSKPIFFFLDEPETFLHPTAQDKLLESLGKLSEDNQIFITTHSPYLLRNFCKDTNTLSIFSRKSGIPRVQEGVSLNLFPYSPSWGEINYKAFGVVSPEFHNELFGMLHKKAEENEEHYNGKSKVNQSISSFDRWLIEQDKDNSTDFNHINCLDVKKINDGKFDQSMSTYIRNYIDHPGDDVHLPQGKKREKPTMEDIRKSIDSMMKIYKDKFTS